VSSLNRHACATLEDVGVAKVVVLKRFLEKICPDGRMLEVDARVRMYTGFEEKDGDIMEFSSNYHNHNTNNENTTVESSPTWDIIIDAIDDVPTKARLLAHCVRTNTRVISCMGAGGKSDITRLHISNLRTASRDPLATKLRQTLRKILKKDTTTTSTTSSSTNNNNNKEAFLDDIDKIAVVYSSEKTVVKLADFTDQQKKDGVHKYGTQDNMRIRVVPVLGTMPAIMGQSLAAMALCELGGKPFDPMSGERVGRNVRHRLFQHLKVRERMIRVDIEQKYLPQEELEKLQPVTTETTVTKETTEVKKGDLEDKRDWQRYEVVRPPTTINGYWVGPPQIDVDDVEYILAEVWRNRCCVTGETLGTVLEITRWDMTKPSNCQNLVLMGSKAMKDFDVASAETGDGRSIVHPDVRKRIEARLDSCRIDSRA